LLASGAAAPFTRALLRTDREYCQANPPDAHFNNFNGRLLQAALQQLQKNRYSLITADCRPLLQGYYLLVRIPILLYAYACGAQSQTLLLD